MTPRATWSPHSGRKRTLLVAGFTVLLALLFATSPAAADLTSITTEPTSPTTCDSVTLVVSGTTPDPCYEIVRAELEGPFQLPTMGPILAYEIRVRLVAKSTGPPDGGACPAVIQPYVKAFDLRQLRFGSYFVKAVEYTIHAGSNAPTDSSTLSSSFDVSSPEGCPPGACVLLGFGPPHPVGTRYCNASAAPGGRASLPITLTNSVPVGGVQTLVTPLIPIHQGDRAGSVPADSHLVVWPVDVQTTDRTAGFQVAWTVEGDRVRVLLYSASGEVIEAGQGPIFRVIWQVSSHAEEQTYRVRLQESIVADPHGDAIPHCPTYNLVEEAGLLCIVSPGCDLNGDQASNILDVVHLVQCALAGSGGSEACPDTVAARADCNGDGSIDVRDVICCVRKILGSGGFGNTDPGDGTGDPTRIGFAGPVQWITPLTGRAEITVTPGMSFAGIDFAVDASSSGARIAGLRLVPGSGFQLESHVSPDGSSVRAMLLEMGGATSIGGAGAMRSSTALVTATILVDLYPLFPVGDGGALRLAGAQSATRLARAMPTLISTITAQVPELATPVMPSVAAARPNPFQDETEISYQLPAAARTVLRVYSASGRLVRTLVDSEMPAGVHRAHWDGKDSSGRPVSSGIYFFRFSAADVTRTQRLMLLR